MAKDRAVAAAVEAGLSAGQFFPSTPGPALARSESSTSLSGSVRYTPYTRTGPSSKHRSSESVSSLNAFSPVSTTMDGVVDGGLPSMPAPFHTPQTRMARSHSLAGMPQPQLYASVDGTASLQFGLGDPLVNQQQQYLPLRAAEGPYPPGYRRPHANSSPPVPIGYGNYGYNNGVSTSLQASPSLPYPHGGGGQMNQAGVDLADAWSGHPSVQGTIITPSGRIQPVLARLHIEHGSPHSTIASSVHSSSFGSPAPQSSSSSSAGSFWSDSRLASPADTTDPSSFTGYEFASIPSEHFVFDPGQPLALDSYNADTGLAGHEDGFTTSAASLSPDYPLSATSTTAPFSVPPPALLDAASIESQLAAQHLSTSSRADQTCAAPPESAYLQSGNGFSMVSNPYAAAAGQPGHMTTTLPSPGAGLTLPDLAAANAVVEDADMRTATRANFRESELAMPRATLPTIAPSPTGAFPPPPPSHEHEYASPPSLPLSASTTPHPFATSSAAASPAYLDHRSASPALPHLPSPSLMALQQPHMPNPHHNAANFVASSSSLSASASAVVHVSAPTSMSLAQHTRRPESAPRATARGASPIANVAVAPLDSRLAAAFDLASRSTGGGIATSLAATSTSSSGSGSAFPMTAAMAMNKGIGSAAAAAAAPLMSKSYSSPISELSARYASGLSLSREVTTTAAAAAMHQSGMTFGGSVGRSSDGGGGAGGGAGEGLKIDANGRAVLPL